MTQNQSDRIKTFITVVEAGSFTKAAQLLNISKSMVSLHIKELEAVLATSLLLRSTRHFSLTSAGEDVYHNFKPLLIEWDQALEKAKQGSKDVEGILRFSSTPEFGERCILPLLAEFSQLYPRLRLHYTFDSSLNDLISNKLDLAIRLGTLRDSSLRYRKLADYAIHFVATPEFISRWQPQHLADLENIPFIANSNLAQINFWQNKNNPLLLPNFQYSIKKAQFVSNSIHAIKTMTMANLGFSLLPYWYIQDALIRGKLVILFPDEKLEQQSINLVFPASPHIPRKVRVFIQHLEHHLPLIIRS